MDDRLRRDVMSQRRRLRVELRSARQASGVTQQQVAAAVNWPVAKVIQIEAGAIGISETDLKVLLRLYRTIDSEHARELTELARDARENSWWDSYWGTVNPRLIQLIQFESAASVVRGFQPLTVPGLLQTEDYATSLTGENIALSPADADIVVSVRMKRQELLSRAYAPFLHFVIDEAVVRRLVGGRDSMCLQIRHLIKMAARSNITLQIVPFSIGSYPGLSGSFVIFEFPDEGDDDILYIENPRGDLFIEDPSEIAIYEESFEDLRRLSMDPDESVAFLAAIANEVL